MGISTFGIPRIVYSGEDTEQYIAIPRGCLNKLCENLDAASIKYSVDDKRNAGKRINVTFKGELYPEQQNAVQRVIEKEYIIKIVKEVQNVPQPIVINPLPQQNPQPNNELMEKFLK